MPHGGGLEIHSVDKTGRVTLSEDICVSFWKPERSWDVLRMVSSLIGLSTECLVIGEAGAEARVEAGARSHWFLCSMLRSSDSFLRAMQATEVLSKKVEVLGVCLGGPTMMQ